MKAVVQRVSRASVHVDGRLVGTIGRGLMVLLGVARNDTEQQSRYLADKIVHLRIFEDDCGKMNRSLLDAGGAMLVVSQSTLLGDCRKGRRPSFIDAASPEKGETLYSHFIEQVRQMGVETAEGEFGALMKVSLVNEGPVTLLVESRS